MWWGRHTKTLSAQQKRKKTGFRILESEERKNKRGKKTSYKQNQGWTRGGKKEGTLKLATDLRST